MKPNVYYVTAEEVDGGLDLNPLGETYDYERAMRDAQNLFDVRNDVNAVFVWEVSPGLFGETHRRIHEIRVPWS